MTYAKALLIAFLLALVCFSCRAEELWKITAYCSCEKCCGRWSDGYFASGRRCYIGGVANNYLDFQTKIRVGDNTFTVEDRGSKKHFGAKWERVKHIDIYFEDHQEAKEFGVKWLPVEVLK